MNAGEKILNGDLIVVKTDGIYRGITRGTVTGQSNGEHDGLVYYYKDDKGNPRWCFASQIVRVVSTK